MAKDKHTHKYQRINLGKKETYQVYRCMLTNCPHYLTPELAISRLSICWGCNIPFRLSTDDVRSTKPMCHNCRRERIERLDKMRLLPVESTLTEGE